MSRKKNRRGGNHKSSSSKKDEYRSDLLAKSDMKNERFTRYYQAQNILPTEKEWEDFMETLRTPLPTTFRVAGSRQTANSLNEMIKEIHVPALNDVEFENQKIPPPVQIPWYPDGLAWQFNVPKKVLRKSPEFKKFHSFLVFETEVGNVSRQESVSMLPPLFLDVEPHHKVMDMCAAPGSKTAQLLEALHAQDTLTSSSIPTGLLLANDSDYKRTHLLIHQSARLPSPALMVTNLDASNYPSIKVPSGGGGGGGGGRMEQLLFDRILCDVPCSGDGTIRKNLNIWKTWQPNDGNGLHGLQLRILQRAMKLLKPDGRIVYSTCSLNPVENEAVIASALLSNPEFHLVDVSTRLSELKRRPGLTSWRPTSDRTVAATYETYEAFVANDLQASTTKLTPGHWPPTNVEELHLERCMRIYPHLQDSGGFFVAVLERKPIAVGQSKEKKRAAASPALVPEAKKPRLADPLNSASTTPGNTPAPATGLAEASASTPSESQDLPAPEQSFKEMPYTFLSPHDPTLLSCINRLHLINDFPSSNVLVRNPEGDVVRSMYLTNDIIKTVIQNNDFTKIRLTAAGTKVFTKQEGGKGNEAQYRILGEGLPVVLPYVDPANVIQGNMSALKVFVESHYPLTTSFEEPFRDILDELCLGCHVVKFPPGDLDDASLSHELLVPIWKSGVSVSLMVDKKAKNALSLRVFGKEISVPKQREKKEEKEKDSDTVMVNADEVNEEEELEEDAGSGVTEPIIIPAL
ncbi:cytosine-5--methyltransferase [Dendrothele bispora CBS 962.96]|uniref:Cytosine-5--methyltransferase n=1 Tax=Dendrothele bispora (strain CBS 962.96) TaxID=1314807 RepID=A0A4S8MQX7_DENBC|nr:cytosine-5--methyltransferase [Dendrothele bispora CBS 962.96]